MAITLGQNIASFQAQRRVSENSGALSRVFERLSSGQRITRASNDAAGLAIADSLRSDARVFTQGVRNLNDGISLTSIADGALTELSSIVTRVRELAEQAANGTFGVAQRKALDLEAQSLSKEYTRIIQTTTFNGVQLFNGSVPTISLQGGYGAAGTLNASLGGAVGTGTFGAATSYVQEPSLSTFVELADLNNDGIQDLVTTGSNGGSGLLTIRLGVGDGTFKGALSYSTNNGTNGMRIADLNNDGQLDFVSTYGVSVEYRMGVGDGTFSASQSMVANPSSNGDVEVGDFNNDGIVDLMVGGGNAGAAQLMLYRGAGAGVFSAGTAILTGGVGQFDAISAADLNMDGSLDLIVGGGPGINVALLGNGNGTFRSGLTFSGNAQTAQYSITDLNSDGILDLASVTGAGTGITYVSLGNGNGTFKAVGNYSETPGASVSNSLAFGDLNGDGLLDMITSNLVSGVGTTSIRLGNGDGTFRSATSYAAESANSLSLVIGDVNQDGVIDFVTAGSGGGGKATVRLGDTTPGVAGLLPFSLSTIASSRQAMAQLDRSLSRISAQRGSIGAIQSRITAATANLQVNVENLKVAESQIRDTDVAQDSAELSRLSILQQASAAILAQANQQPAIALQLLRR